ncbi:YfcE family phosphodiesterase [Clostridium algidicarnis]|uniref:Phosphoesterase n=2 Tax=Clostridium algidicarnis TaxID=37659 RepID=A0A2S6FUM7_9CLOT|nr:metallophosphoesterase [Clostridium algidicarnis]MBB6631663.1 metallophosphoesterase [Clostridium algidicarnis]MBB6698506.1 metallophosphoesterase [Clostridium algidicarnis]MBU3194430.1 metallophosphoesterase [Clostridium algidicarnis]MBU3204569.1 metallophosphoesterase [Clostridium algidicarnis]MBU3207923.1 metallophosphoesterase [Clostridium algidicarnis]
MLVAIISDTHRDHEVLNKIIHKVKNCDYILHLGDNIEDLKYIEDRANNKKIICMGVKGNCDYSNIVPSERIVDIEGHKIFMTHGHNYGVKIDTWNIRRRAFELNCKICLYGHTHVFGINEENGSYLINPGSPSISRDGKRGFVIMEIRGEDVRPYFVEI